MMTEEQITRIGNAVTMAYPKGEGGAVFAACQEDNDFLKVSASGNLQDSLIATATIVKAIAGEMCWSDRKTIREIRAILKCLRKDDGRKNSDDE